uniref:CREB regulated transcription coactivator 1a n=1 Tax=Neogobius melanostomus TaxID=47308 RepID=A0A8C6SMJ3_9GOBI
GNLTFKTRFTSTDTGRGARHHGLVDRVYRDRNRMTSPHRKPLSVDKHGRFSLGTIFFYPRVNSDSALHQSTLTPSQQAAFTGGSQEMQPKRGIDLTQSIITMKEENNRNMLRQSWGGVCKSAMISPSNGLEQEQLKQAAHNTGGSLPDLTNLQFPLLCPLHWTRRTRWRDHSAAYTLSVHKVMTDSLSILAKIYSGERRFRQPGSRGFFSLEQFNMFETPTSSDSLPYSQTQSTLNYSQALMMGLSAPHLQDQPNLGFSNHSNIPNIILTGFPPSLSKDLACLAADLDLDSQFPLDDLKIDPLTLDGLHMLNDPDMVLTDPATEDAFRLDRL